MKQIFIITLIIITGLNANAQSLAKGAILDAVCLFGDTIVIKLDNEAANIQWQESFDLTAWDDISPGNADSLVHYVGTRRYIRAKIIYGDCNPYFSDTLFINTGWPPDAQFTADTIYVQIGDTIAFEDQSLNDPMEWQWLFGDSVGSSLQHPTHVYQYAGLFDVSLNVSNLWGSDSLTIPYLIYVSDTLSITCPLTVNDVEGNQYNTVLIGNQCWLKENLKTTHYANGAGIWNITNYNQWADLENNNTDKAYCFYDNDTMNASSYGVLYTWAAAMNGNAGSNTSPSGVQGICPNGWHVPSDREWSELEIYLGMTPADAIFIAWRGTDQGGKLKSTGVNNWVNPNVGATNSSGFTALPGGVRGDYAAGFYTIGERAYWWSSREYFYSDTKAYNRILDYLREDSGRGRMAKSSGLSVRCVKDF